MSPGIAASTGLGDLDPTWSEQALAEGAGPTVTTLVLTRFAIVS